MTEHLSNSTPPPGEIIFVRSTNKRYQRLLAAQDLESLWSSVCTETSHTPGIFVPASCKSMCMDTTVVQPLAVSHKLEQRFSTTFSTTGFCTVRTSATG